MGENRKVLFFGYGNPGRLDDGLGPACAEIMAQQNIPGVTVDANYLLTVEDAAAVSEYDLVMFADASLDGREPFGVSAVQPAREVGYSSHVISPGTVLALARDLFGRSPEAYMLSIRGYEFDEFGERISELARANLEKAVGFARQILLESNWEGLQHACRDLQDSLR